MQMRYPTRHGIPIPTCEVALPESRLDLDNPRNFNNHHLAFTRRMFGHNIILRTFKDLEYMQELLPKDVHNTGKDTLHARYSPPELPTPRQAMDRIDQAFENGERLHVWDNTLRQYEFSWITHLMYKTIKDEYGRVA